MLDTLEKFGLDRPEPVGDTGAAGDYERIRRIVAFISERWREQPSTYSGAGAG
jgi:AraC family transcriptional regulator of adaptative response/methylated-DNA-[protein]-cysteine methyltransferase